METSKLEMEFLDSAGKKFTISLDEPKPDLTETEIRDAMDDIVSRNIFFSTAGDIVSASGARFVTTTVEEVNI